MDCTAEFIDYADTGYFSRLVLDYLHEDPKLAPFYQYSPVLPDFEEIIRARASLATDRQLLVTELQRAYTGLQMEEAVAQNIRMLADSNTYTVCTAHQPNLFTGYLYFVYKIMHAIKLAASLKARYPQYNFVPVYYMGSEDNDLEELGTVHIEGETFRWDTRQSGAVGRMKPEGLERMIAEVTKHLGVNEFQQEITGLLQEAYLGHRDIQSATLFLVNALFGRYGLITVIADTPAFKRAFLPVMRKELFEQCSFPVVNRTIESLSEHYHAQAAPREINLFYLGDQSRERIVFEHGRWQVLHTKISFTAEQLAEELQDHPERFSPNVILRGLFQETILPDVAFIGGGGELSYWLELKALFAHFNIPFPLLMLRNSVLWVDQKSVQRLEKVGLTPAGLFKDTETLIADFVKAHTQADLVLKKEYGEIEKLYAALEKKAENVDITLKASVGAERTKSLRSIGKLEHKFLRAEKNKFTWQSDLIRHVKGRLFPHNALQERVENLLPFYAAYGKAFIDVLYHHLDPGNPHFTILKCNT